MSRLVFSNCCIKSTKKISKIAILSLFYTLYKFVFSPERAYIYAGFLTAEKQS
jgi:hypothetical protein